MTTYTLHVMKRKLHSFRKDPLGSLKRSVHASCQRVNRWRYETCPRIKFRWPVYDIWRYFLNREATKLYSLEKTRMVANARRQQIINDLKANGISVVHLNDLFPRQQLDDLQDEAEMYVRRSANQQRIKAIESGARPNDPFGKFYLIRLLGEAPVLNVRDRFMQFSLSREVLGSFVDICTCSLDSYTYNFGIMLPATAPISGASDGIETRKIESRLSCSYISETLMKITALSVTFPKPTTEGV